MEWKSLKRHRGKRVIDDDDFDAAISDDSKTIMSALWRIKANAQKDLQNKNEAQKDARNKNEEIISSVASDIKSSLEAIKSEVERKRQHFDEALSESFKECDNLLKTEVAKFQDIYKKFSKDKTAYLRALKDAEEEKEKLFVSHEELRKKEVEVLLSEYEKANAERIAQLEESLKKKKQVNLISYTLHDMDKTLSTNLQNCSLGKRRRRIAQLEGISEEEETQDDKTFSILRKNEETISSVASDIKSSLDELKSKLEEVRQSFAKALLNSSKEFENSLKPKAAEFKEACEMFSKEKDALLPAFNDVISKYKERRQMLYLSYGELRKFKDDLLSEHEKANAARIAQLEESLKKKKREDKIYSTLKKTLGSDAYFLEMEMLQMMDFPPDG